MTEATPLSKCMVQVNVRDADYELAAYVLPHQARAFRHAATFRVTVNRFTHPAGDTSNFDRLLTELETEFPNVTVHEVDYSREAIDWVSRSFFGGQPYSLFDWKGTPIHAMLEPLRFLDQPYFMHLDGDMLIGGDSDQWLEQGISALQTVDGIFAVAPLSGPFSPDKFLPPGNRHDFNGAVAWKVPTFGGRIYMTSRKMLFDVLAPLPQFGPRRIDQRLRGRFFGQQASEYFERLADQRMRDLGLCRLDMLGTENGAYSIHVGNHDSTVVRQVPSIIDRIAADHLPAEQYGEYNLHESLCPGARVPTRRDKVDALVAAFNDGRVARSKLQQL